MDEDQLRAIYNKTEGHCHFCGDPVVFERRGWRTGEMSGYWEVDHVFQRAKGGGNNPENCLAACTRCNRLLVHKTGKEIRDLLFLGLLVQRELQRESQLGDAFERLRKQTIEKNKRKKRTSWD